MERCKAKPFAWNRMYWSKAYQFHEGLNNAEIHRHCDGDMFFVHLGLWALTPNDPMFAVQWPFQNAGTLSVNGVQVSRAGADMKMTSAWDITQGDSSIIVAVIDNGCRWNNPEFQGRIWINKGEIPGNGIDDDHNGYIDDVRGWNFVENNADVDDAGVHGSAVASLIGANANNNIGTAGVDWYCKLMIIRQIPNGPVDSNRVAEAIRYAVDNGARVENMSFTLTGRTSGIDLAVQYGTQKGVVFVGGSGNDDSEFVNYPASIPGVIAVGSTDPDDKLSHHSRLNGTGSNYGTRLDLVAPGNWVPYLNDTAANPYARLASGTSYATAFVSGVCALLLAQNPNRTPAQILQILTSTADDQVGIPTEDTPGKDKYHGWGRVNAFRALSVAIAIERYSINSRRNPLISGPRTGFIWEDRSFAVDGRKLPLLLRRP